MKTRCQRRVSGESQNLARQLTLLTMPKRAVVQGFLLISMAIITAGCTANLPFRTNFDPAGGDPKKAVIETNSAYKLGFVEFDDQGYFWDLRQRDAVEQMICQEAGIGTGASASPSPGATPKGVILVAFVHGWKDNASYDSEGVTACRQILEKLSEAEQLQTDHPARQVIGVYAGWRGLSAEWEPFKELSFWDRKETAHKVGGYGALTRLLIDLENLQKKSLDLPPKDPARTELIIIGHSFGGAAVYSALSQIITERFVDTVEQGKRLKPLGDQVILLNPAFEALRHYDLNQMARAIQQYPRDQRPVLSIFTTKGDWATHYMFPIGRFFDTLFEKNRDAEQREAGLETVGWYKPFITHELAYDASASFASTQPASAAAATRPIMREHEDRLRRSIDNVKTQRHRWEPNAAKPKTYSFDGSVLRPVNGYRPGDPFLIVSVDRQIMADHNDITNPNLIRFIREYIQFSRVEFADHSK